MNRGYSYDARVGPEAEGHALSSYLATRWPHTTREEWEERIAHRQVLLDGTPATPATPLRPGQTLTWQRPPWSEPAAPQAFAVLYQDDDLLAVAKPAGLPTLPGAGFLERTLLSLVRASDPRAVPLHRLGRFTSGLVLCARTVEARVRLSRGWRAVEKRYRALATGAPAREAFAIDVPIGTVPHPRLGTVHGASIEGRESRSEVTVRERRQGAFLCDVRILTGRPHQIRIHLAAAGHPLVGDPLYGAGGVPLSDEPGLPGDPGYLLHAAELRLAHPRTGEDLVLRCAPPPLLRTETLP
ncbi:MAG TPA: pseudouridine synthase [Candidatus Polarisedimenticolaceae bacterium]|nr:pseudouridine synthase [Candidatus Polarisedimenticolaceae bacterium]